MSPQGLGDNQKSKVRLGLQQIVMSIFGFIHVNFDTLIFDIGVYGTKLYLII
jgi:hypothetical protein